MLALRFGRVVAAEGMGRPAGHLLEEPGEIEGVREAEVRAEVPQPPLLHVHLFHERHQGRHPVVNRVKAYPETHRLVTLVCR